MSQCLFSKKKNEQAKQHLLKKPDCQEAYLVVYVYNNNNVQNKKLVTSFYQPISIEILRLQSSGVI